MKSKTKVILDTNALLIPFQFGVDIVKELDIILPAYEILVPSSVLVELNQLKVKEAKPALKYAQQFKTVNVEEKGDKAIIKIAHELQAVVVTNDRELRKQLEELGIKVIFMRQKSYLSTK